MTVSEQTYRQLALEDPEGHWELHCGVLRQKPDVSFQHGNLITGLFATLIQQLGRRDFDVRADIGRVRRSGESYFIPDVYVVPMALVREELQRDPRALESYSAPLPLVVEIWSPSTGDYDVNTKLPEYRRR